MLTLFNRLCSWLMFIGGFSVVAMMLNVVADVVAKLVWNAPIQGTVEMSSYYYMVALVMLPMAFVEMQDQQISVDLLFNHFPNWLKKLALIFSCLAAAAILAIMAWRTGLDAMRALHVGEVVMGGREVIVWPSRMVLPLGFGLASLAALVRAVLVLRGQPVTQSELDEGMS
ncbi:TRAP transporter small permease subunit [Aquicoccus sp. SU-CL01552]|uniref:TRAP transporter small permease n=1 Tax=Aquicoccus sp. SU-CL01552 TaxID=3127656 RepID=UPI00310BEEC2